MVYLGGVYLGFDMLSVPHYVVFDIWLCQIPIIFPRGVMGQYFGRCIN